MLNHQQFWKPALNTLYHHIRYLPSILLVSVEHLLQHISLSSILAVLLCTCHNLRWPDLALISTTINLESLCRKKEKSSQSGFTSANLLLCNTKIKEGLDISYIAYLTSHLSGNNNKKKISCQMIATEMWVSISSTILRTNSKRQQMLLL